MTRKLLEAQEQERARISRELHDDIGQRLALLALDIDLLRKKPSKMSAVWMRSERRYELSRDIHTLSHDLHSARLEYLGVVAGIEGWCLEFGARFKMRVGFSSDVRTSLPHVVCFCLFRVVQERFRTWSNTGARIRPK